MMNPPVATLTLEQAIFLIKRGLVFNPTLGIWLNPLEKV